MRTFKVSFLILALNAFGIIALAQQPSAPQSGATAKGKIAFINTALLQERIGDYKVKLESLNRQFEPRVAEVQTLVNKINALEQTIKTQSGVLSPAKLAENNEQLEQMKREHKRKTEDLQQDGDRAQTQALTPVKEKLNRFLQEFTAKHGISLLVDLPAAFEANTIVWYDQRADVTQTFIDEYNKANPVPGATAPKP